jgi:hypothetical protein
MCARTHIIKFKVTLITEINISESNQHFFDGYIPENRSSYNGGRVSEILD